MGANAGQGGSALSISVTTVTNTWGRASRAQGLAKPARIIGPDMKGLE